MTAARLPISVGMLAGAEAARIRRALAGVSGWLAEIVVIARAERPAKFIHERQDGGNERIAEPQPVAKKSESADFHLSSQARRQFTVQFVWRGHTLDARQFQ